VNAFFGGVPGGRPLLSVSHGTSLPVVADVVAVVLPPVGRPGQNDRRYRIAVLGRGFHGLLTSRTTRIPGLVSIVDVAPTALHHKRGTLGSVSSPDPLAALASLDRQIHANNRLKFPALFIVAGALLLLALLGLRAAATAVPAALLVSIGLGAAQVSNEVVICGVVAAGTVLGALWLARLCRSDGALLALYAGVLVLHLALLLKRPEWVALTPLGPTQNQRFWGIGNQLETLLLAPMLAGAVLARRRFGLLGFSAFALFSLLFLADNRLGADGGGAIVLGVAFAFLGARLLRLGVGGFATLLLAAATTVLAIVSYDLRAPGPNHLRSAFGNGVAGLADVAVNRVPLSYRPALAQWQIVLPLALGFVLALLLALRTSRPRLRSDLLFATGIAVATSLVVNDSAAYVLAGGIAVVGAFARFSPSYGPITLPAVAPAAPTLDARPVASGETET
jgi:hypothetical protein